MQRYYNRDMYIKHQNANCRGGRREVENYRQVERPGNSNSNSRGRFSGSGQSHRKVQKPRNLNSNSRERSSCRRQSHYRKIEKPGKYMVLSL